MIEKIIFNVLAFTLFIFMFFKMIAKNDTTYLSLLAIQAIGIGINFIGLVFGIFTGFTFQVIIYVLAIVLPIIIFLGEKKGFSYSEMVYLLLAKIALAFHSGAQVKDILMKLIEKNPKSYQGHKMLAQWYQKQGAQRKAIEEYVQAIEINKKDYKSYFTIAVLLEDLTQQREAVTMLENLLERKPDYYEASDLLGKILCEQENYKEALNVYMDALKYHPASYELCYNLGMTYTMLNDFQNAKVCYEKAAQINTMLYSGLYHLGQIALIYEDLDEAEKYFLKALEGEEVESGSYYHLAKIAMLKGETDKAVNYLNLAIELDVELARVAEAEPVFIPIKRYIVIPNVEAEVLEDKKKKVSKRERKVQLHLDKTYELVGKLNYRSKNTYSQKQKEEQQKEGREKI